MTTTKKAAPKPKPEPVEVAEQAAPPERETIAVKLGDVTVDVWADARDDFELLDDVSRLEDGDMTRLPAVLRRMMSDKDRRAALETARGDNGRIGLADALDLMRELFAGMSNPN